MHCHERALRNLGGPKGVHLSSLGEDLLGHELLFAQKLRIPTEVLRAVEHRHCEFRASETRREGKQREHAYRCPYLHEGDARCPDE